MIFSKFLMQSLQQQSVGQDYAVNALTRAVTLALSGRRYRKGSLGVLLFAGPTGSGKTHMARSLARVLLGNENKLIYVSCQQLGQVSDPLPNLNSQLMAGYLQSQTAPPVSPPAFHIIVFEDIDKAPASFRDHLALAIEKGKIFTPDRVFLLHDSFIILISDLAKKKIDQFVGRSIGFFLDDEAALDLRRQRIVMLEEIDEMLGARLVSRIDEIIIFERMSEPKALALLERFLADVEESLAVSCIGFIIDQSAKAFLLRKGLEDLTHGVRQIKRAVKNYLEFPLADLSLSGRLVPGTTVVVRHEPLRNFLHFQILIPQIETAELEDVRC